MIIKKEKLSFLIIFIITVFPVINFSIAKTIPAKRNLFVCFLSCSNSYHSVTPITNAEGFRKFAFIALNNDNCDDMWPETKVLSEERRLRFIQQ